MAEEFIGHPVPTRKGDTDGAPMVVVPLMMRFDRGEEMQRLTQPKCPELRTKAHPL